MLFISPSNHSKFLLFIFKISNSRNTSVIITLDLSKLNELWITMENLIGYLRKRIKDCVKEANKDNPKVKEKIIQSIRDRMSSNVVRNIAYFFFEKLILQYLF